MAFPLQQDLADVAPIEPAGRLPTTGLLALFPEAVAPPWGFEPTDLGAGPSCIPRMRTRPAQGGADRSGRRGRLRRGPAARGDRDHAWRLGLASRGGDGAERRGVRRYQELNEPERESQHALFAVRPGRLSPPTSHAGGLAVDLNCARRGGWR